MTGTKNKAVLMTGSVIFAIMSVVWTGLLVTDNVKGLDAAGFAAAKALRTEELTAFFQVLTQLGNAVVLAPLGVVVIASLYAMRMRAEALCLLLTLGGGELLNELLKAVFARARPSDFHLIALPDSFSFPSGHAMIAPAFYCMLALIAARWLEGRRWAVLVQPLTFAVVILLGLSRVYLGVHFMSDVLTGFCLSMTGYCLVRYGYERYLENRRPSVPKMVQLR
ncbi:phosphatase PAP2 family protein [Brevibacillus sp. GCM10020057]|uniref:phosphatase PAP2 family protein n=1 Tax=Brevibacillus sp. GCM10020057 TaxID=3317327 RepID=UPI0036262089